MTMWSFVVRTACWRIYKEEMANNLLQNMIWVEKKIQNVCNNDYYPVDKARKMQGFSCKSCYNECLAFCIHIQYQYVQRRALNGIHFLVSYDTVFISIAKKRTNRPNRRIIIFIHAMNMLPTFSNISIYSKMRKRQKMNTVEHLCTFHVIISYTKIRLFFSCWRPLQHKELITWTDERVVYVDRIFFCHFVESTWKHDGKTCLECILKMCEYWSKRAKVMRNFEVVPLVFHSHKSSFDELFITTKIDCFSTG